MDPEDFKIEEILGIQIKNKSPGATINDLNDKCLTCIFQHLPATEKFKMERISKRWNKIAKLYWSTVKYVDIFPVNNHNRNSMEKSRSVITNLFILILKKSANSLKKLTLRASFIKDRLEHERFLAEIPKYSKNLTILSLVDYHNLFTDENFKNIFDNAKNLFSISLEHLAISGSCLLNLKADHIKQLSIVHCNIESRDCFHNFLAKLKNLNKLKIFEFNNKINARIIDALLVSECENIFEIHLETEYQKSLHKLPRLLSKQKKLRTLRFANGKIDDKIMKSLSSNYIQVFDMNFNDNDSAESFLNNLARFKNLKVFKASFIVFTKDHYQKLFKNISKSVINIDINFIWYHYTKGKPTHYTDRLQNLQYFSVNNQCAFFRNTEYIDLIMDFLIGMLRCRNLKYFAVQNKAVNFCNVRKYVNNLLWILLICFIVFLFVCYFFLKYFNFI